MISSPEPETEIFAAVVAGGVSLLYDSGSLALSIVRLIPLQPNTHILMGGHMHFRHYRRSSLHNLTLHAPR